MAARRLLGVFGDPDRPPPAKRMKMVTPFPKRVIGATAMDYIAIGS